jgi:hypothetical protein
MPGAGKIAADVTAVMPRVVRTLDGPGALMRARLTDREGRELMVAWLPQSARIVVRGARVFLHLEGDEWRQVPVVEIGETGRPL